MFAILSGILATIKTNIGTPAGDDLVTLVEDIVDNRLTTTRAGYLDLLDTYLDAPVSNAVRLPPIASGVFGQIVTNAALTNVGTSGVQNRLTNNNASTTVYDTWEPLISITGSGVINYLGLYQQSGGNSSSRDAQARLVIDSNTVWTSATNAWQSPTDDSKGFNLTEFGPIPYQATVVLEFKKTENAAGTVAMTGLISAIKTS